MTDRAEIEGYLIQSPEITSSSDVLISNFAHHLNLPSSRFPRPRPTFRTDPICLPVLRFLTTPRPIVRRTESAPPVTPHVTMHENDANMLSTRSATLGVVLIFVCSLLALSLVYASFPNLTVEEKQHIKIPWNIDQAKQLGLVLDRYKDDNYSQVLVGVFVTYIFLQTFAIPGSLFLSILSGFLFPFSVALTLVCTCSAVGASLCFMLSQLLGRRLVLKYFPERASKWAVIVHKHRDNLFNYVVFLRVTPFLPNWFINLTAPVIGVPLKPFALGTFFGVAPPSFVAIQAGQTLHTMSSTDSTFSWTSMALLGVFAVVSLIPIFFKQRLKDKFD